MEQQVAEATAALRKRLPRQVVEELAIPSYTHPNWLMRYLVWERLAVALEWLDALSMKPSTVMDFGCGIGILFPSLTRRGAHVLACDIHPEVAAMGAGLLGASGVEIIDARKGLTSLRTGSVDVILALEVLEHVDDLDSLAAEFRRLLRPGGSLLCSLPTENTLYRLGRRLAGFSGAYHVHGVSDVVRVLRGFLGTSRVARLYSFLPLYDFFEARP